MKYASEAIRQEFWTKLHPDTRVACVSLEEWGALKGHPEVFITGVHRTDEQSQEIYLPIAVDVLHKSMAFKTMTKLERKWALELRANYGDTPTLEQLREWAKQKFSWHKVWTAVDMRVRDYSGEQQTAVHDWLEEYTAGSMWELITEVHGTGPHFHLAKRDFAWRARIVPTT